MNLAVYVCVRVLQKKDVDVACVLFFLYIHTIGHEKKGKRSKLLNDDEEDDDEKISIHNHL
jgi:hypothetical protein